MWYEGGADEGTMMYVIKNSTHHYMSWWYISRSGDFDYSLRLEPDMQVIFSYFVEFYFLYLYLHLHQPSDQLFFRIT